LRSSQMARAFLVLVTSVRMGCRLQWASCEYGKIWTFPVLSPVNRRELTRHPDVAIFTSLAQVFVRHRRCVSNFLALVGLLPLLTNELTLVTDLP
jgi:hypothetical protein